MWRPTTRTSPQLLLTSSSRNVSTTSVTPRRSSVPPLVSWCALWALLFSATHYFCELASIHTPNTPTTPPLSFCFPLEMMHKITWVPVKVFVFILSDPELLRRQLLMVPLIVNHYLKSVIFCSCSSRHPDHYYRLQGRAANMARAAAPALQLAQLGGLQHLRGLHIPLLRLCSFFFYATKTRDEV